MKRRTFVLWKKIVTRTGIILAIIGIVYVFFATSLFSITDYTIVGVDETRSALLEKKFNEIGHERIWKIFPGDSIFSYHRKAIQRIIHEILPNTDSVSIYPPSPHTLTISVTPYVPLFKKDERHAITREGVVYTEVHDLATLPVLRVVSSSQITPV